MPTLNQDEFFSPLANTKPYIKLAAEGFAGSGKTYTLATIAIALHKLTASKKPIVIFDTEESSKFLIHLFKDAGIEALVKRSRSLADLRETMKRCRDGFSDVLFIDSISHVYENYLEAYKARVRRTSIEFQDWGIIKPTWKAEFSEPFVRDPYHALFTGRAAWDYTDEKDEKGKRQIYKSGVKMKVDGETAYEPDILLLMDRFEEVLGDKKEVWREATVLKDRSTLIDGKTFKNPTPEHFLPAIMRCLEHAEPHEVGPELPAGGLFTTEEDRREWVQRKKIALDKVESLLTLAFPGQKAEEKKAKIAALLYAYETVSWEEIASKGPDAIEAGIPKINEFIEKRGEATNGS